MYTKHKDIPQVTYNAHVPGQQQLIEDSELVPDGQRWAMAENGTYTPAGGNLEDIQVFAQRTVWIM